LLSIPEFKTEHLIVSVLTSQDFQLLNKYENDNRRHLALWEPFRDDGYFCLNESKNRAAAHLRDYELGTSITLIAYDDRKSEIICMCSFSNIVYGPFQACNLGYSISEKYQGKGLMFEMLQLSLQYIFDEVKLHRVMANYMPENVRSEKLLNRLGFQKEGLAKSYLKIAGSWQDHILTSKLNPNHLVI